MVRPPVTEGWRPELPAGDVDLGDGAAYVDAATVALRFASTSLTDADVQPAHGAAPVTPRSLRDAMGCLATGVCVVTTMWEGDDVAMTANSVTSVSLDPPLVLVCVAKTARFHEAIIKTRRWGLSVLDAQSHELSTQFARPGRDRTGQLTQVTFERGAATGVALLRNSVAQLECLTEAVHPGGDHDIVVGAVQSVAQSSPGRHPLLFHRGQYRWLL